MIERINKNEERLDRINECINNLENALNSFKTNYKDIKLINNYYGSKNWFKDKESFEEHKIEGIKAGVLSEDAVWNMNENITDLLIEMEKIIKYMKKQ